MASPIITLSDAKRFNSKCLRDGSGCLKWTGALFDSGYGAFKLGGKGRRAHRIAWVLAYGKIPDGAYVLHSCDNRACVDPEHLFLGDHVSNMADMVAKKRAARGAANGAAHRCTTKLGPDAVRMVRAWLSEGIPQRDIASHFGVSQSTVSQIRTGRVWAHVS